MIWNGELVRLTLEDAGENGLPPGLLPRSTGANHRTFFLHISSIYRTNPKVDAQGVTILGRTFVSGTLYELEDLATIESVNGEAGSGAMSMFENRAAHMPTPPSGYAFRLLNPPGTNYVGAIDIVAGRYYPLPDGFSRANVAETIKSYEDKASGKDEVELNEKANLAQRRCMLAGLLPPEVFSSVSLPLSSLLTTR